MEIIDIIPAIILVINSITDIKNRIVDDKLAYFLLFYSIVVFFIRVNDVLDVMSFSMMALFFWILYITGKIADGDFIILFSISLLLTYKEFVTFFIALGISTAVLYSIFLMKGTKRIIIPLIFLILMFVLKEILRFIVIMAFLLILSIYSKTIDDKKFYKEVFVRDLVTGDILLEDIVIDGRVIFKNPKRSLLSVEVKKLKEICPNKKVKILWGVPYVPAIFLAYLLTKILKWGLF